MFVFFFAAFTKLLDNYEVATGTAERVTPEEVTENNQFLDAIMETEVMKVRPGMSLSSLNPVFLSNLMHGCPYPLTDPLWSSSL